MARGQSRQGSGPPGGTDTLTVEAVALPAHRLLDAVPFQHLSVGSAASRADSSGRRNTSTEGLAMGTRRRRSDRSGRGVSRSPGRPGVARREDRRRFWTAIAAGGASEDGAGGGGGGAGGGGRCGPGGGGRAPP